MSKPLPGTGTRHYGRRKLLPDGSCIRTKFHVFLFIPLWPIRSHRIRYENEMQIVRMTRVPLCWPQVIGVLAVGYSILLVAALLLVTALDRVISFIADHL
jgi:hypothetical protein